MLRGRMKERLMMMGAVMASAAISAIAQEAGDESAAQAGQTLLQAPWFWPVVAFGAVVVVVGLIIMLMGKKARLGPMNAFYYDTEVETSKYESLMSEIQGLMLRNMGGENRDYYRKISHLVCAFLVHLGQPNAREMDDQGVRDLISQSPLSPEHVTQLMGIFDRCCEDRESDIDRRDSTPKELLQELQAIVLEVDKAAS